MWNMSISKEIQFERQLFQLTFLQIRNFNNVNTTSAKFLRHIYRQTLLTTVIDKHIVLWKIISRELGWLILEVKWFLPRPNCWARSWWWQPSQSTCSRWAGRSSTWDWPSPARRGHRRLPPGTGSGGSTAPGSSRPASPQWPRHHWRPLLPAGCRPGHHLLHRLLLDLETPWSAR